MKHFFSSLFILLQAICKHSIFFLTLNDPDLQMHDNDSQSDKSHLWFVILSIVKWLPQNILLNKEKVTEEGWGPNYSVNLILGKKIHILINGCYLTLGKG